MSTYRKVDPRIWNDAKFRALDDRAKLVFLMLLTHPNMTAVGAMRATLAGMAEELGWEVEAFREAFRQPFAKGMVEHDPRACFVGLPKFLDYNRPESPNVVKAWFRSFDLLPECELKTRVLTRCKAYTEALGEAFGQALAEALAKASLQPSPNQEQKQEQEPKPKPDSSVPNGTGGAAALVEPGEVWTAGKSLLVEQGTAPAQAGSFIGHLIKQHGEPAVLEAVRAAIAQRPADARSWIAAAAKSAAGRAGKPASKHAGFDEKDYSKGFEQ